MNGRLSQLLRGAAASAAAMAVFSVTLGLFLSLTLLVISVEEGGTSLSQSTVPLTQMVILLTQGVGIRYGSMTISLIPLLLTGLMVGLVAAFVRRLRASTAGYWSGIAVWIVINVLLSHSSGVTMLDSTWLMIVKFSLVYSMGHLIGIRSSLPGRSRAATLWSSLPELWRRAIRSGFLSALILLCVYTLMGLAAVLAWVVDNASAVMVIFNLTGMQIGSRILTSICSVAWLPNLCIWAISWLFGPGFSIGQLATFTLWSGQASVLPPVPAFAILPKALENDSLRNALLSFPLICGMVTGVVVMASPRVFSVFSNPVPASGFKSGKRLVRHLLPRFFFPAMTGCIAGVIVSLGSSILFALSNGSLGSNRLSQVGVDVVAATAAATRPTLIGFGMGWTILLVVISGWVAIRWLIADRMHTGTSARDEPSTAKSARPSRTSRSSQESRKHRGIQNRVNTSESAIASKEEQGDTNEHGGTHE